MFVPETDHAYLRSQVEAGRLRPAEAEAILREATQTGGGVRQIVARRGLSLSATNNAPGPEAQPQRFAHYHLLEELGRGGMGVVHRAYDPRLRRNVAIKRLDLRGSSPELRERRVQRFLLEARSAARLKHANVVSVHEVGDVEGVPYLVMDYVEGRDLEALMGEEALSVRRLVEIVRDVARGLGHAHEHQLVHRDVKPANVLVDPQGVARLTDFGLVRDLADDEEGLSRTGQILGTPLFLSPEQAAGDHEAIRPASDVFSLGGLLCFALTGQPPFESNSLPQTLHAICGEEPRTPSEWAEGVHRDLDTIALKCLRKDPALRYADGGAVADELERFLAGEPILARPLTLGERSRELWRRRPLVMALGLTSLASSLALALGGVVGGVYFVQRVQAERDEARQQRDLAAEARAESLLASQRATRAKQSAEHEAQRARRAERRALLEDATKTRSLAGGLAEQGRRLLTRRRSGEAAASLAESLRLKESAQTRSGLLHALADTREIRRLAWRRSYTSIVSMGPDVWVGDRSGSIVSATDPTSAKAIPLLESVVVCLQAGPAGGLLAGGLGGEIVRRDAQGSVSRARCGAGAVTAIQPLPDGSAVVAASGELWRWDLDQRTQPFAGLREGSGEPQALALSSNTLAVGTTSGRIALLGLEGGAPSAEWGAHVGWVSGLLWRGEGELLSTGFDGSVKRWSSTGELLESASTQGAITALCAIDDDRFALSTSEGVVEIWARSPLERLIAQREHEGRVGGLALKRDTVVSAGDDGVVGLLKSHGTRATPVGADDFVNYCATIPGGDRSLSLTRGRELHLRDSTGGLIWASGFRDLVTCLGLWQRYAVVGFVTNLLVVVDLETGKPVRELRLGAPCVAVGGDRQLRVLTREAILTLNAGLTQFTRAPLPILARSGSIASDGRVAVHVPGGTQFVGPDGALLGSTTVALCVARGADFVGLRPRGAWTVEGVSLADTKASSYSTRLIVPLLSEATYVGVIAGKDHLGLLDGNKVLTLVKHPAATPQAPGGIVARFRTSPLTELNAVALGDDFLVYPGTEGSLTRVNLARRGGISRTRLDPRELRAFASAGKKNHFVVAGSEGRLTLVEWREHAESIRAFVGHSQDVVQVSVDPRGEGLASGDLAGEVRLWDLNTGVQRWLARLPGACSALVLTEERVYAAASSARVFVFRRDSGERLQEIDLELPGGASEAVTALTRHAGEIVAATNAARLRRLGSSEPYLPALQPNNGLLARGLASSPRGDRLALSATGVSLTDWWRSVRMTERSSDKRTVLAGAPVGELAFWSEEAQRGEVIRRVRGSLSGLSFSPDGELLAGIGDAIGLFDGRSGRHLVDLNRSTWAFGTRRRATVFLGPRLLLTSERGGLASRWDLEALGVFLNPEEAVERVWLRTGYRVVGNEVVTVRDPWDLAVRRAMALAQASR